MSDNLPNIELPINEWVDLYSLSGVEVGTALSIENIGVCDVYLAVQATKPAADHDSYDVLQRDNGVRLQNNAGDPGAWAYCNSTGGKINVHPEAKTGFYPNSNASLKAANGQAITVQNPLPTDGDSIYEKDINVSESTNGTFTGNVVDLFNDYTDTVALVDNSATNPKTFEIQFTRPVTTNEIGFASANGNFSNVKIDLVSLAGNVRNAVDESAIDTKRTDRLFQFTKTTFIKAIVEFHTADPVSLNAGKIQKILARSISSIDGLVSISNSSTDLLLAGETFTGGSVDTLNYGIVLVTVAADVDSAVDGVEVQFRSGPNATWRTSDKYTFSAPEHDEPVSVQTVRRFMRVLYANGTSDQGVMDLETTLKPVYIKPSSHRTEDEISGQDDAELVINVNKARKPDGTYTSIGATDSENLKIANAEDAFNVAQGNVVGQTSVHKFGRGANIDSADGLVVLWDGAEYAALLKDYTYSATDDIDRISSDNNGDTVDIEIHGLDANWDVVVQTITLTGQTPAVLTTDLIRVYRMVNVGATDLAGNVFCFVNDTTTLGAPDTITNTRAMIINGNNQTLMCLYPIPNAKTAFILNWYGSLSSAKASSFNNLEMKARPFGKVFQLKHTSSLSSAGTSYIYHNFTVPQSFPSRTDFVMLSDSSVNDNAVSAGFDLILVDD